MTDRIKVEIYIKWVANDCVIAFKINLLIALF